MVSGPKIDFQTTKATVLTCELSKKLIDFSYNQAEQKYPGEKFYKGFSTTGIITAGGGEISYPDGTKETIICK